MKFPFIIFAALAVAGCADTVDGNPDGTPYAGSPGSIYDSAANPPAAIGTVAYDPANAPSPMSDEPTPGPSPVTGPAPNMTPRPRR